jgi:DNA-binding NtrC family response regulator
MAHDDRVPQVCLAGRKVSSDWPLIQALKGSHTVTLVDRVDALACAPLLATTRVLVLDAAESVAVALQLLPVLRDEHPALAVLLVNGGLDQRQVARAFRDGARDYFPVPYDVHLLAERVTILGLRPRARRAGGKPPTSPGGRGGVRRDRYRP